MDVLRKMDTPVAQRSPLLKTQKEELKEKELNIESLWFITGSLVQSYKNFRRTRTGPGRTNSPSPTLCR